jgi:hypothetical protein
MYKNLAGKCLAIETLYKPIEHVQGLKKGILSSLFPKRKNLNKKQSLK